MVDLALATSDAVAMAALVLGPLLLIASGFVGALYGVLRLILFFADLF